MHDTLRWYVYFNAAIAISYIITRIQLFITNASHCDRLKFARYSFCMTLIVLGITPLLLTIFPKLSHSNDLLTLIPKITPSVISTTPNLLNPDVMLSTQPISTNNTQLLFMLLFVCGFLYHLIKFIKNQHLLKNIIRNVFGRRKLSEINIYYSDTNTPFCWAGLTGHHIVIPIQFLENKQHLSIALQHELQHIRQYDTRWVQLFTLIKIFCFWNLFIYFWIKWMDELQEFSCDENIILRKKSSPIVYAECLMESSRLADDTLLPQSVLGIRGKAKSVTYRRIKMLFEIKKFKKSSIFTAYTVAFISVSTIAYGYNSASEIPPLTAKKVSQYIKSAGLNKQFHIDATPEVVAELNNIIRSDNARLIMRQSLQRMEEYKPYITASLKNHRMPTDLLAVPLIESGYQNLEENKNPVLAAGIWQIIPDTGKRLGLAINETTDERMNSELSTQAALSYLQKNYQQFNDWRLAVIAYEIGEDRLEKLINRLNTKNSWAIANSKAAPPNLKPFLARFDAELIIMHHPNLVDATI